MGLHPHDHIQPWERYPQGPGGPGEELLLALLVAQLNQGVHGLDFSWLSS